MLAPSSEDEGQETYKQLVTAIGQSDAPAGQQLSALRSVTPLELHEIIADRKPIVFEDTQFFSDWEGQHWEEVPFMPSWVHRVVVGQTHDENVLFAQRWESMASDELYREWQQVYPDANYAQEVLSAYGITHKSTQAELVAAYVAYTGDAMFAKAVHSIATTHLQHSQHSDPKVYMYSFDQPDILSPNPVFYNGAYHSQDNAFLFCHPPVAGSSAPPEFQATARVFSDAALAVINGKEPWEDISVAKRFMSMVGDQSALRDEEEGNYTRWKGLVDTNERFNLFMCGRSIMYAAMAFAMSLPVDVHRK